jgi:hypothetical protein
MNKSLLPFHKTGWLYLIILLWAGSYLYHQQDGFEEIEQFNIDLLFKSKGGTKDLPNTIANISSTFKDENFNNIKSVLALYQETPIAFLGELSDGFIDSLKTYLKANPRKSKLIIGSHNFSSSVSVTNKDEINFNSVLDPIRYNNRTDIKRHTSSLFVYSPLVNEYHQKHSLFWRNNNQTYLTLDGEILRQLVLNHQMKVQRGLHIELSATHQNTLKTWPLGFNGEIYIQSHLEQPTPLDRFLLNQENTPQNPTSLKSDFSAIIISEANISNNNGTSRVLETLINHQYLYQTVPVIALTGLLLLAGIGLLWFSIPLSFKKQFIIVSCYIAFALCAQYLVFREQQWMSILPNILTLLATWGLMLAYKSENKLFIAAYKHQSNRDNNPSTKNINSVTKTPRKLVSKSSTKIVKNKQQASLVNSPTSSSQSDDLDATMVVTSEQAQAMALTKKRGSQATSFGRYEVEGVLGKGAMGIVYQGVDPKINRHVAIKTLQLNTQESAEEYKEAKNRFFREAQTAGGLSHSNIVTIYDVGEEGDLGYISMDLLTGAPLSEFIKPENLLPPALVYQLMIQITDALEYAHTQNVVHRDIKPANVIFDDDLFKVTVTDFGIAYVSDNSKTKTGVIMGSPYYMSPEQILGLKVDGRSDIFSLGVTFYQLLSGILPFQGESIATVAYQITKSKATAVNQVNSKLPASAQRITNKAMHKDINKRYQTMGEFQLALENALKRDFKNA